MKGQLSETVARVHAIGIKGNVVPCGWYENVTKEKTGYADGNAIAILSEVVNLNLPVIECNADGNVVSIEDGFYGKLPQKSYTELASKFGMSEKQARIAVANLERLGLVRRVWDDIECKRTSGYTGNGTPLYLELNVDRLAAISYNEPTGTTPKGKRRSANAGEVGCRAVESL